MALSDAPTVGDQIDRLRAIILWIKHPFLVLALAGWL